MGNQDEMVKIEMIEGLQRALDNNFQRLRENARREWEMRFAGNDPSDACAHVRITSGKPSAGVIKKPAGSLLFGTRRLHA